ncbi:MAG: hypothetical protein H6739_11475 [Alphaproteobacteria bacterium]|nr:hypothetical protein [Alphaproteobacteria bacterium]
MTVLGLALASAPSWAADQVLVPTGEVAPVLLRADADAGAYYPLAPDGELTYEVVGPAEFQLVFRQRLPTASGADGVTIQLLGDGQPFMKVDVSGALDESGVILDLQGGFPTVASADTANLSLKGEHTLTVKGPGTGNALLLQVVAKDSYEPAPVLIGSASEPEAPATEPAAAEPAAEGTEDATAETDEPAEDDLDLSDLDLTDLIEDEGDAVADDADVVDVTEDTSPTLGGPEHPLDGPASGPPAEVDDLDRGGLAFDLSRLEYGARLGMGGAAAGSKTSGYFGVEARLPLSERVGVGLALGRYGIRLEQEVAVQPALGGVDASVADTVAWRTGVWPLEATARYRLPVGPVHAYGAGGLAMYFSNRVQDDAKVRGVSLGTVWALGADIELGPGTLTPSLSLNTGRRGYDNPSPSGDEARERLRTARLNAAYFISF